MSGTNEDNRAGSADSENSSDSFVQVSKEDAPAQEEQLMADDKTEPVSGIPSVRVDDQEDIHGAGEETTASIDAPSKEVKNFHVCERVWVLPLG